MYQIKLSPYAKTFYTEWLLNPDNTRYNVTSADQTLFGNLDVKRLRRALYRYVSEHVLLNSHIQDIHGVPYWVKNDNIHELEYSDDSVDSSELLSYVSHRFDLYQGPLYRFKLIRVQEGVYRFIVVFHHLVMDGISLNAGLFEEVSCYYNDEKYITKYSINDQIELITNLELSLSANLNKNAKKYEQFWNQQLSAIESLDLRFLKLDKYYISETVSDTCNTTGEVRFSFGTSIIAKLNNIKNKYNVTPYIYSQCIFAMLLHKYTGQEHFAITYPIAIKEGVDFICGGQVNLNLIPCQFSQTITVGDLLSKHREFLMLTTRGDMKFGYYPITDIVKEIKDKQLLDVYFSQAYFRDKHFNFLGIKKVKTSTKLNVDGITPDILLFEQEPVDTKLNYRVKFNTRIIDKTLLNNFILSYKKLFIEVLNDLLRENANKLASNYFLLSEQQYQKIVYDYNRKINEYPQNKAIHELFEEQALRTPANIAIVHECTKLTYTNLNEKANQLANYLRQHCDIQSEDFIVLCLDRSEYMLIAILAVLKAGAAYVPISPDYPDDRINHILEDTKSKLVLTNEKYQNKFLKHNERVVALDMQRLQNDFSKENTANLQIPTSSTQLAYVIYTSGTTGAPKGVLQQHNNVMRLFTATHDWFHFTSKDVWTLFHSYTFDFTIWEIWGALLYGGKLIIPTNEQVKDPHHFYELCYQEKVTVLNQTPTAFYQFMDVAIKQFNKERLSSLRYVIFGGEALNFGSLRAWFSLYGYHKPRLINMYGITETTVFVTYKEIKEKDSIKSSCIGIAIPDQKIYILDKNLVPLPLGAIGELYVGGSGLAREYLNQPNLTKERFISNPFQTEEEKLINENSRLYKTGDLVRMLSDRNLEYIGRNDCQVKIRGYRIELGEIESKLKKHPAIKQAVIIVKEHKDVISNHADNKYLVAYYVSSKVIEAIELQDYLETQLPEYMRPNVLMRLNKLPITINGKIDKKALPEPNFTSNEKYAAPCNKQEKLICKAFASILGVSKIGINHDFFKLGGDSIRAIRLTLLLQENFNIKVADIFNLRTPKKLAAHSDFGNNIIKQKLEQVKLYYKNEHSNSVLVNSAQKETDSYFDDIKKLKISFSKKAIVNVLLTGATGYLGCNILNQLLKLTSYNVFLLIRANSQEEASKRIDEKFQFYFDSSLEKFYNSRVFVIKSDIEMSDLGLSSHEYQNLATKIDSIIHVAALVKHYGDYGQFYSANVHATINLLELAKLTHAKDFHYISTCSVLQFEPSSNKNLYLYTEKDLPDNLAKWHNVYNWTKFQGEQQTVKYRKEGVTSNIYRVGNLAFISDNYRTQENINDNAFFNWLNCLINIKCISKDIGSVQISQVDLTAQAIVKLFDKEQLVNNTYHVFNPYLVDLLSVSSNDKTPVFRNLTIEQFIDAIVKYLDNRIYRDLIIKFLLHQGWLDGEGIKNRSVQVLQDKTQYILKQLDFEWLPITSSVFNCYLESLRYQRKANDKNGKNT